MKMMFGLVAAAVMLSACGSKNTQEGTTITVPADEGGKSATVRFGGEENGISAPENLPAFAPVYPGAIIQSAISGNEGEAKGMVSFTTDAKATDVLNFYREKGKSAGLKVKGEMAMGPTRILSMGRDGSGSEALQISASPGEEGKVMVAIIYDGTPPS